MRARSFKKSDAPEADRLLVDNTHGDVRLDKDTIGVTERKDGTLSGIMVGRVTVYSHEFRIDHGDSLASRLTSEHLLGWALGWLVSHGFKQLTFCVAKDNLEMQKFMEDHGAIKQKEGIIYHLEVE